MLAINKECPFVFLESQYLKSNLLCLGHDDQTNDCHAPLNHALFMIHLKSVE